MARLNWSRHFGGWSVDFTGSGPDRVYRKVGKKLVLTASSAKPSVEGKKPSRAVRNLQQNQYAALLQVLSADEQRKLKLTRRKLRKRQQNANRT